MAGTAQASMSAAFAGDMDWDGWECVRNAGNFVTSVGRAGNFVTSVGRNDANIATIGGSGVVSAGKSGVSAERQYRGQIS
jgi:hypothetical protein